MVADYLRIQLLEVDGLDYLYFLQVRKDAFITKLNATEAGREYLDKAWQLSRTDNDRDKSRRLFMRM